MIKSANENLKTLEQACVITWSKKLDQTSDEGVFLSSDTITPPTCCLFLSEAAALHGQPFFYMAFVCYVNVYMVSVHTSST